MECKKENGKKGKYSLKIKKSHRKMVKTEQKIIHLNGRSVGDKEGFKGLQRENWREREI